MKAVLISFLLLFTFVSIGCKSAKTISDTRKINRNISAKKLLKENQNQEAKFNTLQAKLKISFVQGEQSHNHSVNIRMQKNKTIWLNATLGFVRAQITKEKVSFYNKLNNTYFDGDYALLNKLLGIELDFEKLQNVFLGEKLFQINDDDDYSLKFQNQSYVFKSNIKDKITEFLLLLNPKHFKVDAQHLKQISYDRSLQINYKQYQQVEKQLLPEQINIVALDNNKETVIDLELKSITLNKKMNFPFKIPSGYQEIVLNDL